MTSPVVLAPPAVVAGTARLTLPFGLFSVVTPQTGDQWEAGGITWEQLTCDGLGGVGPVVCPPESQTGRVKDLGRNGGGVVFAAPFTVYGHYTCTPVGFTSDEAYEKAEQHLLTREQQTVEAELWSGGFGSVPNFNAANGYAALTDQGTFDVSDLDVAVAHLEAAFSTTYGSLGVLHMSREYAALLKGVRERSGRLYTRMGTPIVAGAGYSTGKIVATSQLVAYRSEVFPGDISAGGFDTARNNYTAIAERTYVVGFDECGAAQVTITTEENEEM